MHQNTFDRAQITQEFLKDTFDYDAIKGRLIWKNGTRGHKAGDVAGTLSVHKKLGPQYRQISIGFGKQNVTTLEHRLVFLWHHGYLPKQVDHINLDKTDNRIENLRAATASQNQWNRGVDKASTTKLKGVCFDKNRGKWMASIKAHNKAIFLGRFNTQEEAYEARKAAQHLHGEFARL